MAMQAPGNRLGSIIRHFSPQRSSTGSIILSYSALATILLGILALGVVGGGLLLHAVLTSGSGRPLGVTEPPARAWIGITYGPLTPAVAANAGISLTLGALVISVTPGSPAAKAGIDEGDIVTAVDQRSVDEKTTLANLMMGKKSGDVVHLSIVRQGKRTSIDVLLERMPRRMIAPGDDDIFDRIRSGLARFLDD